MGVRNFVKRTAKDNTNVKGWTAWDAIYHNAKIIGGFAKSLKSTPEMDAPPVSETFEQAVARFNLTEAQLKSKMRTHWSLAILCFIFGCGGFLWSVYLLWDGLFLSTLVSFSLTALMLSYGYYEHISYYRIKKRKLDFTFSEWLSHFFRRS